MRKLVLTLLLVVVLSSMALAAADVDPALFEAMKTAEKVEVIVQMVPGAKHVDVATMGGKLGYTYSVINGFSAELPVAAVNALTKNPNVSAITLNKEVQINLNVAMPTCRVPACWSEGWTGAGVTVAIIDTGIYPHVDFGNRIIAFKDFINYKTAPYDDNGHGTHCAGSAAGAGSTYRGAAYECNLVGVKVLNRRGSGTWDGVIAGIDWCAQNKSTYSIDILSMSLGGTVTQSSTTDPVCTAVRNAWNNYGLIVCVAAGNEGPTAQTIGTPGNEPCVITVGAVDDRITTSILDDVVASYSSRGPTAIDGWTKPDVVAPGTNIASCDNASSGYVNMSGTSMATPIVAGICALGVEKYPTATNNYLKQKLISTARPLAGFGIYDQGAGLVDAYAFLH